MVGWSVLVCVRLLMVVVLCVGVPVVVGMVLRVWVRLCLVDVSAGVAFVFVLVVAV